MSEVINALIVALKDHPDSLELRLHLANLLLEHGDMARCLSEVAEILARDPGNAPALALIERCSNQQHQNQDLEDDIDWARLDSEVGVELPAPFIDDADDEGEYLVDEARLFLEERIENSFSVEESNISLENVGGLEHAKERINLAFLEPLRNPDLAKTFGKSLRGGLLLYGPPGTGKTYLGRAVAGELQAKFLTASLADILDGLIGAPERRIHELFTVARRLAPCVLFIDEIDSLGGKRANYSGAAWMRNVVNQLLQEMDGVNSDNEGVFVLAATNHPWDVDEALLRPGRLDRMVFVSAPDPLARETILRRQLAERPIAGIDLRKLVAATNGFSGADLNYLVQIAVEQAMTESIRAGSVTPITMNEINEALKQVRPTCGSWLQMARNVVSFSNTDGRYDELREYLKKERML